jgi:hypothetical protein
MRGDNSLIQLECYSFYRMRDFVNAPTNQVTMAKSNPFVEADPAMIKLQFIRPPKNAARPVKGPPPKLVATLAQNMRARAKL